MQGAQTTLHVALHPELEGVSGKYFRYVFQQVLIMPNTQIFSF